MRSASCDPGDRLSDRSRDDLRGHSFVRGKLPADEDFVLLAESFRVRSNIDCRRGTTATRGPVLAMRSLQSAAGVRPVREACRRSAGVPRASGTRGAVALRWPRDSGLRRVPSAMSRVTPANRSRVAAYSRWTAGHNPTHQVPMLYCELEMIMVLIRRTHDRSCPRCEFIEINAPISCCRLGRSPGGSRVAFVRRERTRRKAGSAPDAEQAIHVSRLRQEDLWRSTVLLAQSAPAWRKVARIVGMTIGELSVGSQHS
jgi:hypothetical protein